MLRSDGAWRGTAAVLSFHALTKYPPTNAYATLEVRLRRFVSFNERTGEIQNLTTDTQKYKYVMARISGWYSACIQECQNASCFNLPVISMTS
jgi:hypothetical protein